MFSDLNGAGLLGVAATGAGLGAAAISSPLAVGALLAGGGILVADLLKEKRAGKEGDALRETLIDIFDDVNQLRTRMPYAASLIEECQAEISFIEDIHLEPGDPAKLGFELYKAIKYDNGLQALALNWLMEAATCEIHRDALLSEQVTQLGVDQLVVLKNNHCALLELIQLESEETRQVLAHSVSEMHADLGGIQAGLIALRGDISDLAKLVSDGSRSNDVSLEELREAVLLLNGKFEDQSPLLLALQQQTSERDYAGSLLRIAVEYSVSVSQLQGLIDDFVQRTRKNPQPSLQDQALADLSEGYLSRAVDNARKSYNQAIERKVQAEVGAAVAAHEAMQAAQVEMGAHYRAGDYQNALEAQKRVISQIDRGLDPLLWSRARYSQSLVLDQLGRVDEAINILNEIIEIGEEGGESYRDLPLWLEQLGLLMVGHRYQFRLDDIEGILRKALRIREAVQDSANMDLVIPLTNLAYVQKLRSNRIDAIFLFRRALELSGPAFIEMNPSAIVYLCIELGDCLLEEADGDGAAENYLRALEIIESKLNEGPLKGLHFSRCLNKLASLMKGRGELQEAEEYYCKLLKINEANFGENNLAIALNLRHLAELLEQQKRIADAAILWRRCLKIYFVSSRTGVELFLEPVTESSYTRVLEDMGWTPEEIAMEIVQLKREAGVVDLTSPRDLAQ